MSDEEHFHTLGYWELDHQLYDVHHLMVLSYHLQHPWLYSPETLEQAKKMLVQFVEEGVTPQTMRQHIRQAVDSGVRKHRVIGTPESHGEYAHPVTWSMTIEDVVNAGIERYYESVQAWAESILSDLRESGNL
jgi:hypothetical protein